MKSFISFLAGMTDELYELFQYSQRVDQADDPELEKQLAGRIIRKASDARAKREIEGA